MATNWKQELKSWTKPTKGIQFHPFKAAYHVGKAAFRHPYLTIAAGLTHGVKKGKWAKRNKWFNTPLAGQNLKKWYF